MAVSLAKVVLVALALGPRSASGSVLPASQTKVSSDTCDTLRDIGACEESQRVRQLCPSACGGDSRPPSTATQHGAPNRPGKEAGTETPPTPVMDDIMDPNLAKGFEMARKYSVSPAGIAQRRRLQASSQCTNLMEIFPFTLFIGKTGCALWASSLAYHPRFACDRFFCTCCVSTCHHMQLMR